MTEENLVYSTEIGSICPKCNQLKDNCICNSSAHPYDNLKTVRVSQTNKGRKGKTVTLVKGMRMSLKDLKAFTGKLKKKTGTGGSLKDGVIVIQGGCKEKVSEILLKEGWDVR